MAELSLPAGVCVASTNGSDTSTIYQCESGSNVAKAYNNLDCSGRASTTIDLCAAAQGETASCNSCCGVGGCDHFVERTYYDAVNCSDDEPEGFQKALV